MLKKMNRFMFALPTISFVFLILLGSFLFVIPLDLFLPEIQKKPNNSSTPYSSSFIRGISGTYI